MSVAARVDRGAPVGKREAVRLVGRAARAALADHGVRAGELSVTLVDDATIAAMNARYLGHDAPTDVIAFALHEPDAPPIGDVYIGWDQAMRQAESFGAPPAEELARLAIHGTLHVLGYDHPEGAERVRSAMWKRQESILRGLEVGLDGA